MRYDEQPPVAGLAPFVDRIWTLEGHASMLGGALQPVLPDGRPEIVMHLGDGFHRVNVLDHEERQHDLLFAGQLESQLVLRPGGVIKVLGIRFHPFGAAALLRVPQDELAGLTIDLRELSRPLTETLRRIQDSAPSLASAADAAQRALLPFVTPDRRDPRVRHAVREITRRRGMVSIDRVADAVGLTRRHLERQFNAQVGITPKRLARITRFQHAVQLLDAAESTPRGAETAATCGYADQAHFIRDFRDLAGCAPSEHLMRQAELTRLFTDRMAIAPFD